MQVLEEEDDDDDEVEASGKLQTPLLVMPCLFSLSSLEPPKSYQKELRSRSHASNELWFSLGSLRSPAEHFAGIGPFLLE